MEKIKSSLKTKTMIFAALIFIVAICITAAVNLNNISDVMKKNSIQSISEIGKHSTELIREKINQEMNTIHSLSAIIGQQEITDMPMILDAMDKEAKYCGATRIAVIDNLGNAISNDNISWNVFNREYFQEIMSGKTVITNVINMPITANDVIVYGVPIFSNGMTVGGIIAIHNVEEYEENIMVSSFDGKGYTYVIRENGQAISADYRDDVNIVFSPDLTFEESNSFKGFPELKDLPKELKSGKTGTMSYKLNGKIKYVYYEPIGINDWYMLQIVPGEVVDKPVNKVLSWALVLPITAAVIFAVFFAYFVFYKKQSEKKLRNLAYNDPLTGIGNWSKFNMDSFKLLKNGDCTYALVNMDVDKFKLFNDVFGYYYGDSLLKHIADKIMAFIDEDETAARISGDIFQMLLKFTTNEELTKRIKSLFFDIIDSDDKERKFSYKLSFSCGIYIIDDDTTTLTSASDRANIAKNNIKGKFDDNIAFYTNEMKNALLDEQEIESRMDFAIENNEFEVYLQPQYSLINERISGAEALIRWNNPEKGFLQPYRFIPIFEKNGFIVRVDYYVFEAVCKKMQEWANIGRNNVCIAVNMSRFHIHESDFVSKLLAITDKYGVSPENLEIELTETVFFDNQEKIVSVMMQLKTAGFRLSMDDFGSGYSSLNILTELPVDIIKIDREFFRTFETNEKGKQVVTTVIQLARSLKMLVVAEGVETVEQVVFLKGIDCDMVQGYYYAKPMTIEQFEKIAFDRANGLF
ncbi:MAG: EAL domain-containing protein [Oscillospiraceae bacterium]